MSEAKKTYRVTTWDSELQKFTPQKGLKSEPYTKWELRTALTTLRNWGYDVKRAFSPSVLVERVEK